MAKPFTKLDGRAYGQTLIARLGPLADKLRDLRVRLGDRPYRVFLVWTRWTGGERGNGTEELIREVELLPVPRVADLTALNLRLLSIGLEEAGDIRVSEISTSYDDDLLLGRTKDGAPVEDGVAFYWELLLLRADGETVRRRFVPKSVPHDQPTKFGWSIDLERAAGDRQRSGEP